MLANTENMARSTDPDRLHTEDLLRDQLIRKWKQQARKASKGKCGRNLYVITLHPDTLEHAEFRHANPGYVEGMPCVYVGMTIHAPGDRFQQHKTGYRSSKYPRRYGVELALELMEGFNPDEGPVNAALEAALAEWLRAQGYAVWQN